MPERYFHTLPAGVADRQFFRRLDRMRLANARRVRGMAGGERVTQRPGASIEFAGHRAYGPGDDLRYLDWHLLARLDTPYTRTYHEQEYYYTHVLLDSSASMHGMGDGGKFAVAKDIAVALSYLALANDDRLNLVRRPGDDAPYRAAGRQFLLGTDQMPTVRRFLSDARPHGSSAWGEGLARYAHRHRRRLNRVFLISDFLAPVDEIAGALGAFLAGHGHITLLHLIEPSERTFLPDRSMVLVRDRETGHERRVTLDEANRRRYETAFVQHGARLAAFCHAHGVSYIEVDTAGPWYDTMWRSLTRHSSG